MPKVRRKPEPVELTWTNWSDIYWALLNHNSCPDDPTLHFCSYCEIRKKIGEDGKLAAERWVAPVKDGKK